MKSIIIILFLLVCSFAIEADELQKAADDAKMVMMQRELELKRLGNQFKSLKVQVPLNQKAKHDYMSFGNETLHCASGLFPWPLKDPNVERKDCVYKLNIADDKDIKKLYATLEFMKREGWSIEKQEVHEQHIINDTKILNTQRVRFTKVTSN
ncbi:MULTISPECIES: hypothetical protein [Pseudoalteromonas]|uniref:hypothetical protein n=1 Tax=Pseudoalteromonas TaxID=53246 RepID=UPI001582DEBD|nr:MULTISPECIES: hypothetical protein [Pseudoalteromonas]MDI4652635.1 hypothetical protein [Pseudoalteromonas shioyasakiensis]NUJ38655.1 hypothetical protein [Pseudoalteromonas sp. 0303]